MKNGADPDPILGIELDPGVISMWHICIYFYSSETNHDHDKGEFLGSVIGETCMTVASLVARTGVTPISVRECIRDGVMPDPKTCDVFVGPVGSFKATVHAVWTPEN